MSEKPIIVIDAGHGGHDPGAVGPSGVEEKRVAMNVAANLAEELRGPCEVVMTREEDEFLELSQRAAVANTVRADLFLSIHCNAGPPGRGEGFEVYTSPGETESDRAAVELFRAYADEFPDRRKRMDLSDGDEDKEARFTVLTRTRGPAVLFELEFIHTEKGERWLKGHSHQVRAARALARGVRFFFGLPEPDLVETEGAAAGVEMVCLPAEVVRSMDSELAGIETSVEEARRVIREAWESGEV